MSQEKVDGAGLPIEIDDSYEEEQRLSSYIPPGDIRVEVGVLSDSFDRDGYYKVPPSSQPSQTTPSQPSQDSQPSQHFKSSLPAATSSEFRTSASNKLASFIWDEDIEGVIPDSQEPGDSPYKLPDTPTSKTRASTTQSTENNTEAEPEAITFKETQLGSSCGASRISGDVDSQLAEPAVLIGASTYNPATQERSSYPEKQPRNARTQESDDLPTALTGSIPSSKTYSPTEGAHPVSTEFRASSGENLEISIARRREVRSAEGARTSNQVQISPDYLVSLSPRFQTQPPQEEFVASGESLGESEIPR